MRAILIDPEARTITEIDVPIADSNSGLWAMQSVIGGNVDFVQFRSDRFTLFCDENGLNKNLAPFTFDGRAFVGKAIIVGSKPNSRSLTDLNPAKTVAKMKARVRFEKRDEIGPVSFREIGPLLQSQGAVPAPEYSGFDPQLQFILSNRFYAEAAAKALRAGRAKAFFVCQTGFGGVSMELQYASAKEAARVGDIYNAECDRMKLA